MRLRLKNFKHAFIVALRPALLVGLLVGSSFALTGCAHDRHTGAVIGGIVGATIGYVITSESEHHDRDRYPKHQGRDDYGHHPKRTGYQTPPPRDPYCR